MNRIELSLIVTLILAIISGVFFIGNLNGRVEALQRNQDLFGIIIEREKAISSINTASDSAINKISENSQIFEVAINNALPVYSCPSSMPSDCQAANRCQSMCTGQLQIEKATCINRKPSGIEKVEQCTMVGKLIKK